MVGEPLVALKPPAKKKYELYLNMATDVSRDGSENKRKLDEDEDEDEGGWVGPLPNEATQTKKKKVLEFERLYLDNLPSASMYERSYMHRDVITHIVCSKTDFIITASQDGHVKFWKKKEDEGVEFVKHFRSHLGVMECISVSAEGALFCSVGDDQAMKVFDVVNFDMINMLKLGFHPGQCEWIYNPGDAISTVACSEKSTGKIFVYDGRGSNEPLHTFEKMHTTPLSQIRLNPRYRVIVSADKAGMLEYWTGLPSEFRFPRQVEWQFKTDTDLYEFAKCRTYPTSLAFSQDGKKMATIATDRKVRIFRFLTGKLMRVFDESLTMFTELQQMRQQLPDMEFGRRMAVERELEKVDGIRLTNIIFDETGHFVLYGTMLGIKVINVETNRCVRILGKQENIRVVQLSLFQGVAKAMQAAPTIEMKASDNPALQSSDPDPTIFCTAFKKNRFYMFTKREPEDTKSADSDRDIFNEKPSKEEVMAATQAEGPKRVSDSAIIHTTMGDIHIKLFPVECVLFYRLIAVWPEKPVCLFINLLIYFFRCPKTVENFCVHSRNGYYNSHIFHRVIKGFMIQTGDPTGTGMGGESIWGGEFEDEFHATLRHDRPYTLSMANAGPGTNGSQFFITVVPTPWLDNKHTVFGRTTKGMEVVQRISNLKVNPKTDKPYEDISIINITVK
uniref:peptidylprolyl isomerase n=1 Tax=Cyprinus carpio TaxID=7962 RepID=A0A8C1X6Q3_CYPCA